MEMYKQKLSNGVKTKYLISFIIISLALFGSIYIVNKIFAQGTMGVQNIQYPVKELGNCKDESACKSYCDKSENTKSCVNFAEKNNLMSKEEIGMAKKFMAMGSKGPGGCRGKDECDAFCNDMNHIDECVAFAEKNDLMSPGDLKEAKMVQAAIKRGVKPPACKNKTECNTYCEDPSHMKECIAFGEEAGFIQGKELEDAKKMLTAIEKGATPPPCKGKEACDAYCSSPDNIEACMTFAQAAGLMSPEEAQNSQKMIAAVKKGFKPPNCNGKECDTYCAEDAHIDECINFSIAAGFMTEKDAEMAKKTKGKGPGNCKGKDECDAFCNNPDNQETCFNFAKENGMILEADLKQMEEGKQKFQESLQQTPPAVLDCLDSQIGTGLMEKFKNGAAMPPREIGDKMRGCFEKMDQSGTGSQGKPGAGGMIPPAGQTGPDQKFQPAPGTINPGGQTMPQQAGPGGCKGPEECKTYCESHPDECKNSGNNGQQQFAPGIQPNVPMPPQENREEMMPPPPGEGMMPGTTQPPINQQPPTNMQPPAELQPPMNNIAPPPPPPSGFIIPESLLSSMSDIFLFMFKRQ